MYRNLFIIAAGLAILAGLFAVTFTGKTRGRADFAWVNGTEPQSLDPGRMSGEPEGAIAIGLFEGLTTYHPATLEPLPGVAKNWKRDGLTYSFELRPDCYWVRQGEIVAEDGKPREVRASDFVYAWQRHFFPETASEYSYILHIIAGAAEYGNAVQKNWTEFVERYKNEKSINVIGPKDLSPEDRESLEAFRNSEWRRLVGVKTPDDRHIDITLQSPVPYFLSLTSFYVLTPVYRPAIEAHGDEWTLPRNMVSNGPYFLESWKFNACVRLQKNEHYWETSDYAQRRLAEIRSLPEGQRSQADVGELAMLEKYGAFVERGLDTLDALAVEQQNTSLNLYINGDVDYCREIAAEVVGDLIAESQRPGTNLRHVHWGPSDTTYFFEINLQLPVFQGRPEIGRKLRRALSLAIDRRGLIDGVTRKDETPAYRLVPITIPNYDNTPLFGAGDFEKDVEEAKRLIAEVRAAGVRIPPLTILYNTHQTHEKIAGYIQSEWKRHLGLESVNAQNQEWGVFLNSRRTSNFDVARSAWIADYPDANTFLDMFTKGNQNNDPRYDNPHYDRIVRQYAADILKYLDAPNARAEFVADVKSWPSYAEVIAPCRLADGELLGEAFERSVREFATAQDANARIDAALLVRRRLMEIAEAMLIYDMPIIPIYFYKMALLWPPELEGIAMNLRSTRPLKPLRWQGGVRPAGARYADFPRLSTRSP